MLLHAVADETHPIVAGLERTGMSVRELARRIADDPGKAEQERRSINRWIAGTNPSVPKAKRLADVLGGAASDYRRARPASSSVAAELAALRAEVHAIRSLLADADAGALRRIDDRVGEILQRVNARDESFSRLEERLADLQQRNR